ncbi:topology modulation protein [Dactylosporangium sp. CA-092794]|uniref:topology modulation protein n=1 Tax=Dactylosporangium sp. CA-092794 TaxID=3239929 RepID=UPI003D89E1CF
MQRVAIIGAGGAGKTVLANQLSVLLDLPVTHLDALRYTPTWHLVPEDEFAAAQRVVTATDRWIIDGNSLASMPIRFAAADTIVFLDLPARACLWGVLRRRWRYRGGQHADGVHDRITWSFLTYIVRFRRRTGPAVRRCIADYGSHAVLVELTSRRQVQRWLAHLHRRAGHLVSGEMAEDG